MSANTQSKYFCAKARIPPATKKQRLVGDLACIKAKMRGNDKRKPVSKTKRPKKVKHSSARVPKQLQLKSAVKRIPKGKVCTVDKLAQMVNSSPQWVARIVRFERKAYSEMEHSSCIHRVVMSDMSLDSFHPEEYRTTYELLRSEGVEFNVDGTVQARFDWDSNATQILPEPPSTQVLPEASTLSPPLCPPSVMVGAAQHFSTSSMYEEWKAEAAALGLD